MAEIESNVTQIKEEEEEDESKSIYSDPNVAVIVSFINQFGTMVTDPQPIMSDLMSWISNTDEVVPELQDLHVKLLRKLKRSVNPEKWEKAIVKFCYVYGGSDDAFEVERYGYLHSSSTVKLRILKNLLEGQFDVNAKFKNLINAKPSHEMRLEPFGKDKEGNVYYCQVDEKASIRIYQENQDEESWAVVAANREELVKLIEDLKGQKPIRPMSKDLIDEDSSSNSRPVQEQDEKVEEKKGTTSNEQEYKIDNLNASEEFPLKQTIRLVKKNDVVEDCDEEKPEIEPQDEKETATHIRTTPKKRRRK